ncbi:MAG: efflux RND transporter permease subunit [Alphaproteobacteria bacterium TMED89]|nr:hypothetical protein [Rhodospirillaceae bacterium]RPH11837.1 MAG: efflux RND transporter permease subunit [Alphaproteobacteria bacterium TMED89]
MMNSIIEAMLRYNRTVLTLLVALFGAGVYSWFILPKEAFPNVTFPSIYVSVYQNGISPEDAEDKLIKPLEGELSGVDGLKTMTSTASQGYANVVLEFEAGFDEEKAEDDIRLAVDRAKPDLPEDANEPVVTPINLAEQPILVYGLTGPVPEKTLVDFAKDLKTAIEVLPGVLEVTLGGDRERVIEVVIRPATFESYNLDINQVASAITNANQLVVTGTTESSSGAFDIELPGELQGIKSLEDLPIMVDGNSIIRFSDIAEIRDTFRDASNYARVNGQPSVSISVSKRTGTNTLDVTARIKAVIEAATTGTDITATADTSKETS